MQAIFLSLLVHANFEYVILNTSSTLPSIEKLTPCTTRDCMFCYQYVISCRYRAESSVRPCFHINVLSYQVPFYTSVVSATTCLLLLMSLMIKWILWWFIDKLDFVKCKKCYYKLYKKLLHFFLGSGYNTIIVINNRWL